MLDLMKFEWITRWFRITVEIFTAGLKARRYTIAPRRRLEFMRRDLLKRTRARMGLESPEGST